MKMLNEARHAQSSRLSVTARDRAAAESENERVWLHLDQAERAVAERAAQLHPPSLDRLQRINRALLIEELRIYKNKRRYPINRIDSRKRVPRFIDERGTRCAMAHLIEITGHGSLVQTIAATENEAYVRELSRHASVRKWLSAAGLSMQEAARIQPTYCFLSEAEACFCNEGNESGIMLGTVLSVDAQGEASVRIDRIDLGAGGAPADSVGDVVDVSTSAAVGDQVFVSASDGAGYYTVGWQLSIENDEVTCSVNDATQDRPVSVETAIAALEADGYDCVDVLKNDDSDWNQSQCQPGYRGDGYEYDDTDPTGDGETTDGETTDGSGQIDQGESVNSGCSMADPSEASSAPITSLAILIALLSRRGFRVVKRQL